jgi:hypothetical protein
MATYKYKGEGERVFPSLGIKVKSGDTFDGPDNLIMKDVELVSSAKPKTSASTDLKVGDE